jgi:phenylpyruvate tautomerase PptA (4-oxalocrotonate tautomerase family)
MGKIWNIYGEGPKAEENPEAILNEYAKQVSEDTEKKFVGIVTESIRENTGAVTYALYIIVPELKDYMYRLIEVNLQNLITPYPLEVSLFAKDPRNHRTFTCDNVAEFRAKLVEIISSPVTSGILMHLKTMIEIKKGYES